MSDPQDQAPDHSTDTAGNESGQLSESAHSRTSEPDRPGQNHNAPTESTQPGNHGRPTDDSDPGHS